MSVPNTSERPRPLRVLIVDDNVDAASTLALILRHDGYDVHVATDGKSAIENTRRLRPQVMICDLGMPVMGGLEVARTVRADESCGPVVLIALTGFGDEYSKLKSQEAGFEFYLIKPVDPEEVEALLRSIANR